jgi:2-phosphoglycerate kinase
VKSYVKSHIKKYQAIQNYLIQESKQFNFNVLEININHFEETTEAMHDIILSYLEQAYLGGQF